MTTESLFPSSPSESSDPSGDVVRPVVELREKHVYVEPGETARVNLTVRNVSGIIETYDLTPMGPVTPWASVLPSSVSLLPGEEESSTVSLRPPISSAVVAGEYILSVRARSEVDARCMDTDEVRVTVSPFYRYDTDIARTVFQARTRATAHLSITNRGNSMMTYAISAIDPEGYIKIVLGQSEVTLAPGETLWLPINLRLAPRFLGTANNTHTVSATVVPLRDEDSGLAIVEPDVTTQPINLLHKPFIRLRFGFWTKLLVMLATLAAVGLFVASRVWWMTPPVANDAPSVPTDFSAELSDTNQPVLTWSSSSGATGYVIYAIGSAGDPAAARSAGASTTMQPAATGGALRIVRTALGIPSPSGLPTPPPLPPSANGASPLCEDCTVVAAVDRGTTRYVVEQAPAGEACYRIAARADEIQSFFSPAACVHVRTAAEQAVIDAELAAASPDADSDGAGVAASTPPPCAPVATDARPISATAIAILWKPATKPPAGWSAPDPTAPVLPSSSVPGKESSTRAAKICDPSATITGWTVQRKIFTGWSDVSAAAKPNDTAIEVTGLEPDTKYCFRMNAQSADGESKNTKKFCTTTRPVIEASSSPDTAGAVSPSASGSPAGPAN